MMKEIFLLKVVDGLGAEGDVVKVTDGYARNYLIPHGLAAILTPANKRQLEKKKQERTVREAEEGARAKAMVKNLEAAKIELSAKAGEDDKLYGSITASDIASKLMEMGFNVKKKQIKLTESIRSLGEFQVTIDLHSSVKATGTVVVVSE